MKKDLHAAVIGINRYSQGITPLRTATRDASAIAAALKTQHGYTTELLLDEKANRSTIENLLYESLPRRVTEETTLLIYFAGHGVAQGDGAGDLQGYLLPHDAQRADETTWLSMSCLYQALDRLGQCRHLLLILDCCFAGSFRWATTRNIVARGERLYNAQLQHFLKGDAWHLLTSAAHNEKAFDIFPGHQNLRDPENQRPEHSPFAAAFLEGVEGAADSSRAGFENDGIITVTELHQFIYEKLIPKKGRILQTPGLYPLRRENTGEYIFKTPNRPLNTRDDPPLDAANNPWLGLNSYSHEDHERFFGREAEILNLCQRLKKDSLVVVIGASGSGKSSLVRAGVAPRFQAATGGGVPGIAPWVVKQLPRLDRVDPVKILTTALQELHKETPGRPALLVIDQFEELFARCAEEKREPFLQELLALLHKPTKHSSQIKVILTVRSDFEPHLRASPSLSPHLTQALVQIPPPSAQDLRRIIEGPAELKALYFESPALVERLQEDVLTMPGALPMLSFALAEMYRHALARRRAEGPDRALTWRDFKAIGGVVGSLHNRATDLRDKAPAAKQEIIRWVFLRMVTHDGGQLARRRVSKEELSRTDPTEQALVLEVLEDYKEARLISSDGKDREIYYEPGHDTLVLAWPALLAWLKDNGPIDAWRDLWRAAKAWHDHPGSRRWCEARRGLLWTENPRLAEFADLRSPFTQLTQRFARHEQLQEQIEAGRWRCHLRNQMNALEQSFIDAAAAEYHRRRRRGNAIKFGAALLLTLGLIYGFIQSEWKPPAEDYGNLQQMLSSKRKRAQLKSVGMFHAGIASTLQQQGKHSLANLIALRIPAPQDHRLFTRLLHESLAATDVEQPHLLATLPHGASPVRAAAWNHAGTGLITLHKNGTLQISGEAFTNPIRIAGEPQAEPQAVSLSADGNWLMTSTMGGTHQLWNMEDGSETDRFSAIWSRWQPEKPHLLLLTQEGRLQRWKPPNKRKTIARGVYQTPPPPGALRGRLQEGWKESWIADLQSDFARQPEISTEQIEISVYHPGGDLALVVSRSNEAQIWHRSTKKVTVLKGEAFLRFEDRPTWIAASWSPDGRHVLTASTSELHIWDQEGHLLVIFHLPETTISQIAWSPQGDRLFTLSPDASRVWAVGANLIQGVILKREPRCLSITERQRYLRESEPEATRKQANCQNCLATFSQTLDTEDDEFQLYASMSDTFEAYQKCVH